MKKISKFFWRHHLLLYWKNGEEVALTEIDDVVIYYTLIFTSLLKLDLEEDKEESMDICKQVSAAVINSM